MDNKTPSRGPGVEPTSPAGRILKCSGRDGGDPPASHFANVLQKSIRVSRENYAISWG